MTMLPKKAVGLGALVLLLVVAAYVAVTYWTGGRYTPRAAAAAMVAYAAQGDFRFPSVGEDPIRLTPDVKNSVDGGLALPGNTLVLRSDEYNVTVIVMFADDGKRRRIKACIGYPAVAMPAACKS